MHIYYLPEVRRGEYCGLPERLDRKSVHLLPSGSEERGVLGVTREVR